MRPSQRRRLIRGLGAAVVVAAVVAVPVALTHRSAGASTTYDGTALAPPVQRPSQTLTATDGKPWNFATQSKGKVTLLYFGYTHCPDICPTTMADVNQALEHVSAATRADTQVVFVTTDPARDTTTAIRSWLDGFNPSFIGLTGAYSDILAMSNTVHGGVSDTPPKVLADGSVDVEHGSQLIGLTPQGGAPVFWIPSVTGPTLQNELEHDLPLLVKGIGG